jgi:hypothetical protein
MNVAVSIGLRYAILRFGVIRDWKLLKINDNMEEWRHCTPLNPWNYHKKMVYLFVFSDTLRIFAIRNWRNVHNY